MSTSDKSTDNTEAPKATKKKSATTVSWRPATLLDVTNKKDGLSYRWIRANDEQNVQKKLVEGWRPVNNETGGVAEMANIHDSQRIGASMESCPRVGEMRLFAMPQELADARKDYYQKKTDEQVRAVKKKAQTDMSSVRGAKVHGKIVIE